MKRVLTVREERCRVRREAALEAARVLVAFWSKAVSGVQMEGTGRGRGDG